MKSTTFNHVVDAWEKQDSEIMIARGPQRKMDYGGKIDRNSKLLTEKERRNCNYGHHYWFIEQVFTWPSFFCVLIKWKCGMCGKEVQKTVSPVD